MATAFHGTSCSLGTRLACLFAVITMSIAAAAPTGLADEPAELVAPTVGSADIGSTELLGEHLLTTDGGLVCPPLYVTDPGPQLPMMGPVYSDAVLPWQTGCADCCSKQGCGSCWPRWFASASGLVMTRTLPGGAPVSTRPGSVVLTTADASANWPGGVDFRLGRWFGPQQRHGVEGIYWGLYNIGTAATVGGGGLNAVPTLAPSIVVDATAANTLFENASEQRVARNDLVNDAEVNWLYAPGWHPERLNKEHRWSLVWLAGFRFFQLLDTVTLTSPETAADPLILDVTGNNNLLGGQVGARVDWRIAPRVRLATIKKFMIAGNSVSNLSTLQTADGINATFADGSTVNSRTTGSTFAYLGSLDGLVAWDVTDHWSLWVGYRLVGVGNILQADTVWPSSISDPGSLALINTNGSTLIHGGFAGFESRY